MILAGLLVNLGLGAMGRMVPSLPVFFVALPLQLLLALLILERSLPAAMALFGADFGRGIAWLGGAAEHGRGDRARPRKPRRRPSGASRRRAPRVSSSSRARSAPCCCWPRRPAGAALSPPARRAASPASAGALAGAGDRCRPRRARRSPAAAGLWPASWAGPGPAAPGPAGGADRGRRPAERRGLDRRAAAAQARADLAAGRRPAAVLAPLAGGARQEPGQARCWSASALGLLLWPEAAGDDRRERARGRTVRWATSPTCSRAPDRAGARGRDRRRRRLRPPARRVHAADADVAPRAAGRAQAERRRPAHQAAPARRCGWSGRGAG